MPFFGKNIKKIRSIKSLSQQAFADLFGLKRGTLGAYEEERSQPKIDTVIKIANYFSISMDSLLKRDLTVNELMHFKSELMDIERAPVTAGVSPLKEIPFVNLAQFSSVKEQGVGGEILEGLSKLVLPISMDVELVAWEIGEGMQFDSAFFKEEIVITTRISNISNSGYYVARAGGVLCAGFVEEVSNTYRFKESRLRESVSGNALVFFEVIQVIKKMNPPVLDSKTDVLTRLERIERKLNL